MGIAKIILYVGLLSALLITLAVLIFPWWVWVILIVLIVGFIAACFLFPPLGLAVLEGLGMAAEAGMTVATTAAEAKVTQSMTGGGHHAAPAQQAAATPAPAARAAPATPAATPAAPRTPTNYKSLAKMIGFAAAIGGGLYFLLTYMGIISIPAIVAVLITLAIVYGASKGNPLCQLAAWTSLFLFLEVAVVYFLSGSAILTIVGLFVVLIASLALPTISGKRTNAVAVILILTTIVLGFVVFKTDTLKKFVSPGSQIQKSIDALGRSFGEAWNSFRVNLPGLFKQGQLQVQRQINIATGDYEEGIEAQSSKQLGVFLENLGLTETTIRQDGVIDLYARLRAESFTTTQDAEPLLITVKCYEDKTNKTGSIRPQDTFTIEEYETFDLDCLFNAKDLAKGSHSIAMEATFDFSTSAFLKSYFMDQETVRSYTRQRLDPLDEFQIADKKPVAIYTPGPMRIGMSAGTQPIQLIPDREEGPTLGLTIERAWLDGELVELKELTITVPPGLTIDKVSGLDPGTACTSSTTQEQVCKFDKAFVSQIVTDLTKPFTTIRIFTKKGDPAKLLAGAPLSIRSFKTDIKYKYRIKKLLSITITEAK